MARVREGLPLVYSCSGASSAAQTANALALRLDSNDEAQMSCIAGVGGDVPHFVREVKGGRPIIALDGCPLACVKYCLQRQGVEPDTYVALHAYGVKKRYGHAPAERDIARLYPELARLARRLQRPHRAADGC